MQPIGIYGMGLAGGLGLGLAAGLEALAAGRPRLSVRSTSLGEVEGVFAPPLPVPEAANGRRLSPWLRLSLAAAREAADGHLHGLAPERLGVVSATGFGSLTHTAAFLENMIKQQEAGPQPANFIYSVHNAAASAVALAIHAQGYNLTISHFEASFELALLAAGHRLAAGYEDRLLVFGADEWHVLAHEALVQFRSRRGQPGCKSLLPGEGAGALLLGPAQADRPRILEVSVQAGRERTAVGQDQEVQALTEDLARHGLEWQSVHRIWINSPEAAWPGWVEAFSRQAEVSQGRLLRYPALTGEFFSASALAGVLASSELSRLDQRATAILLNEDVHHNRTRVIIAT